MALEIEYKFLIKRPCCYPADAKVSRIEQYYLLPRAGYDARRVRVRTTGGVTKFTYNEKRFLGGMAREENERVIDVKEFEELLAERDPDSNVIAKTRYAYPYAGHVIEIDVFDFWDSYAVMEIETTAEGEHVDIPEDINIIAEVTGDERFFNKSLAKVIPDLTEFNV